MLCLTYDDGPGRALTPRVLEMLSSHGVRATFYLLGRRLVDAPELPVRLALAGNELAAHSMWHTHAWKTLPWRSHADVEAGFRALGVCASAGARFRPPYGKLNVGSWLALRRRGAAIDWWTIDSGDTWPTPPQPERVADAVARAGGGVVLMHDFDRSHDGEQRAAFVLATTEALIARAQREGLQLATMSELHQDTTGA